LFIRKTNTDAEKLDRVTEKVEFSHHLKKRVHPAGHLCGRRFLKSLMSRRKLKT
jgi:hypothetical protein